MIGKDLETDKCVSKPAESRFLETLFHELGRLKDEGINYAVMRNHQSLPYSAGGGDLDLIVSGHEKSVKNVALSAIEKCGGSPIGIADSLGFFKIYALGRCEEPNCRPEWWGLRLDFSVGIVFRGRELLNMKMEWPMNYHLGIPVLEQGFSGVLGVLKEVLYNDVLPNRYIDDARHAATHEWPKMEALFAPMGKPALTRLRKMLMLNPRFEDVSKECANLRRDIWRNAYNEGQLPQEVWRRVKYEWSKVRRYAKPCGIVIAVLGVDGAGKSTLMSAISPVLKDATHGAVIIQHLRPGVLPSLARLKGDKNAQLGPVVDPHKARPSGRIGSLLRLAYLAADYWIGYWLWTRPKIAKEPTLVIFDRYAYDMGLDPRRFRIGITGKIPWWFARLAPRPDLIVCLHGNPETIAARKGELSFKETKRQIGSLKDFANKEPRAVLVTTDIEIEKARDEILDHLLICLRRSHGTIEGPKGIMWSR